ncbi:hypothetical protein BKA63DRAFT_561848 [Paraphoma chrysanthemicola]|nr:hypothetical protein BKA63DRAFT_561848 [Paraphoma chrysanthemicola]
MIYAYALSYESGLFKDRTRPSPLNELDGHLYVAEGSNKRRSNPLKLVCKQLRAETTGLELSLNTVTFRGDNSYPGSFVFSWFMECECSPAHKSRMREVVVSDVDNKDLLSKLTGVMEAVSEPEFQQEIYSPKATTFKIYFTVFNASSPYYMWTSVGSELQQALHETVPDIPANQSLQEYEYARWILVTYRQDGYNVPANVQLLPSAFNELKFRLDVAGLMNPEETDRWVQQCHSWVANGF